MKAISLAVCLCLSCVVCMAQGKTSETKNAELFACVRSGDAACVASALGSGASANAADKDGVRVLSLAAEGRSKSIVLLLLGAGAQVNARKDEGEPLCRAALFGRKEIVETLLDHGAKAAVVCDGDHGDSALMEALRGAALRDMPAEYTEESEESSEDEEGSEASKDDAKSDAQNEASENESGEANTWQKIPKASVADFLAVARLLLARGADVNVVASCEVGETALMYAAMGANLEMVKELLSRGADARRGGSVLEMLESFEGSYVKARLSGLPVLSKEQAALVAWNEKTSAAREEILKLLKAAGAQEGRIVEAEDNESCEEAVAEAAHDAFTSAIKRNDVEELKRLVKGYAGHPLGARALPEALRTAVIYNRREMLELLLASGVDPNGGRFKPLAHAVSQGNLEFVRMLLDAGADVNATEDDGRTALDLAEAWSSSSEEHRAIIELLKAHGGRSKREK